jgi:hypothetical protein
MIKHILFFIAVILLFPSFLYSQVDTAGKFNRVAFVARGDLNKDNIADSVIVLQDTLNDISPYKLKVFLSKAKSGYSLVVESDSAIEPQFPDGKDSYRNQATFSDITIASGILIITAELTRGHYEHKFRYQNGNFELIGFSDGGSDGHGVMYTTDFNLSTGVLIEISERYDMDKVLSKKKKIIKVRPLPKLQNFRPFLTDIY